VYELVVMLNSINKNNLRYVYRKFELFLRPQPLQSPISRKHCLQPQPVPYGECCLS